MTPTIITVGKFDLTLLGVGSVVGAGVFVLTGIGARDYTGPSIAISYCLAAFSAFLSGLCYLEFAVDVPVAGGLSLGRGGVMHTCQRRAAT